MNIFEVGTVVLKEQIDGECWEFRISKIFHLSSEEYAKNIAYNDTLGNWEPDKELPENSVVTITATNNKGSLVKLKWTPGCKGVFPHIREKGWSKGLV